MKKLLIAVLFCMLPTLVFAQSQQRNPCFVNINDGCTPVGTNDPLPTSFGPLANSSSVPINVSTAATTQLVALSGTSKIYVTSFDVVAGGTGNITFVAGTGTNCANNQVALTGPYNLTAQNGLAKGSGSGAVLVVPSGRALCVTTSAVVQMSGSVSYTQF